MGFLSPKAPKAKPIILPTPEPTKDFTKERKEEEATAAANRLRVSERRKRGRRASILSNISEEEAQSATVSRPAGRASKVLFG